MIVDDEIDARNNLKLIIGDYCDELSVQWEADSAESALKQLITNKPDVLFLDIHMPGLNGLEMAYLISEKKIPIVFVTAYDQYAIEALKVGAIDYLLKPFTIPELQQTIHRIKQRKDSATIDKTVLEELLTIVQNKTKSTGKYSLPWKGGFKVIDFKDVIRVESDNSYSTFFLSNGSNILVSKGIGEIEALTKTLGFYRIHNSHLINLEFLASFSSHNGDTIILSNKEELPVSRRRVADFKENFNKYLQQHQNE